MKAKAIHSIHVTLEDGRRRRFTAGGIYDVSDLRKDTIKAHFETPEISPPKKQTRDTKGGND
jgi:hypothetical protein